MNLYVIETGYFKLDGGAMFGVVPKVLWQKSNPPDENNLCSWSMRCLLIEDGDRLILIDNGIGEKQDQNFLRHYHLFGDQNLKKSIHSAGFSPKDITDMFLTHLHFDHCGGGVELDSNQIPRLTFPNARYWSQADHWSWAIEPNAREKASFLKENILPIKESGQLEFVEESSSFPQFDILTVDGHTEKQMIPKVKYKDKTIVFMADLLPSVGHIPLPYVMGYDTRPLLTLKEKAKFLQEATENEYILFFEHDPVHECATLKMTDKGPRLDRTFPLADIL